MTSPHPWQDQAACRDQPPERFTQPEPADIGPATATCRRCEVRQQCLDTALGHDPLGDVGIWGGTTPDERDQIRRAHLTDRTATLQVDRPTPPSRPPGRLRRYPEPRVTVAPDRHGDYTDATGRVIIFRLPADDWMLMVDGRPHSRTRTIGDAQQAAWQALRHPSRARPQRTAGTAR